MAGGSTTKEEFGESQSDLLVSKTQPISITNVLVPEKFNSMDFSYKGEELTGVTYKLDEDTVASLTLAYTDDGKLSSITKA